MLSKPKTIILAAGLALTFLFFISCAQRYPFFIQQPEFQAEEAGEGYPGIMLSIVCEDEYAQIRYTLDSSEPDELHGFIYESPIYLAAQELTVKAVAVRIGYDAGPVAEYHYVP